MDEEELARDEIIGFFMQIDSDSSGLLDRAEVKELMEKIGTTLDEAAVDSVRVSQPHPTGRCAIPQPFRWQQADVARVGLQVMAELDKDNSGQVDLPEFLVRHCLSLTCSPCPASCPPSCPPPSPAPLLLPSCLFLPPLSAFPAHLSPSLLLSLSLPSPPVTDFHCRCLIVSAVYSLPVGMVEASGEAEAGGAHGDQGQDGPDTGPLRRV